MAPRTRRTGFTLVELLTVIAIITVLAALLLPVFSAVRGKAREVVCVSNLRQIGLSMRMYADDYDELYPWAVDPTDKYTPQIWLGDTAFYTQIASMPMVHDALQPYVKSQEQFRCPGDSGYSVEDFTGLTLDATPSSFEKFRTSYNYRTEIAEKHAGDASFRDPSTLNVMMDAAGKWHGGEITGNLRYNVLFGDNHTKNISRNQLDALWQLPVVDQGGNFSNPYGHFRRPHKTRYVPLANAFATR